MSPPATSLDTPRMADLPTYQGTDGLEGIPYSDENEIPPARSRAASDSEGHRRNRSGPRRNRSRASGGDPYRPAIPAVVRLAGVVSIGIISLLVIWQMLRGLFTPPPAPPIEQPQVQLDQPPVAINNPAQPEPTPPPPVRVSGTESLPELTGPLAEWQGVQQVRVISNDGINIRQQPSLTGAIVGAAPRQALLRVVEVQAGEGQVPVWLRIERDGAPGGWIAAQSGTTRLVERP
jgi:hypothetical protein